MTFLSNLFPSTFAILVELLRACYTFCQRVLKHHLSGKCTQAYGKTRCHCLATDDKTLCNSTCNRSF